jgi:hypothetical protein
MLDKEQRNPIPFFSTVIQYHEFRVPSSKYRIEDRGSRIQHPASNEKQRVSRNV